MLTLEGRLSRTGLGDIDGHCYLEKDVDEAKSTVHDLAHPIGNYGP